MEENTTATTQEPATEDKQAVSMEALKEASKLIATKKEVDRKIASAVKVCANITLASTEKVVALFSEDEDEPETDPTPETEA